MYVITAPEAPRFQLPGVEFTALAAPRRGSHELCTWRIAVDAGLRSPQAHTLDHDERRRHPGPDPALGVVAPATRPDPGNGPPA